MFLVCTLLTFGTSVPPVLISEIRKKCLCQLVTKNTETSIRCSPMHRFLEIIVHLLWSL